MRHSSVCLLALALLTGPSVHAQDPQVPASEQPISLKRLPLNIVQDQKEVWKFPVMLTRGQHWKPTFALLMATTALVELDPHETPYFRRTKSFADFNKTFSSLNTGLVEAAIPAAFFSDRSRAERLLCAAERTGVH